MRTFLNWLIEQTDDDHGPLIPQADLVLPLVRAAGPMGIASRELGRRLPDIEWDDLLRLLAELEQLRMVSSRADGDDVVYFVPFR